MAVIECGPMATPARLAANRQNVPPETGRPAEDLGAMEAIAVACLAAQELQARAAPRRARPARGRAGRP